MAAAGLQVVQQGLERQKCGVGGQRRRLRPRKVNLRSSHQQSSAACTALPACRCCPVLLGQQASEQTCGMQKYVS